MSRGRMGVMKIGEYYLTRMVYTGNRFRIVIPKELSDELLKEFKNSVPIGVKFEGNKLIILLNPKIELSKWKPKISFLGPEGRFLLSAKSAT